MPARPLAHGAGLSLASASADDQSLYRDELNRVRASLPDDVLSYVHGYVPRDMAEVTDPAVVSYVRVGILAVAPLNKHTASQTAAAISSLVLWGHRSKGLPLKWRLLLSNDVMSRWQTAMLDAKELSEGTVRNYRGHLARVSHALGVELDPRFDPLTRTSRVEPYSEVDLKRLTLWSKTLTQAMTRRATALLCLGAGAGLEPHELLHVRAQDVISEGGMWVKVGGANPRFTPVLEAWRPKMRRLIEDTTAGSLLFPRDDGGELTTMVSGWLKTYPSRSRPVPQRLRTTWVVEMLRASDDDARTLEFSGIARGETLARYLPHLGKVDRARRSAMLRLENAHASGTGQLIETESDDAAHRRRGRSRS